MDKGKSRTDLLAAGRRKLEQYRKKKDHKTGGKPAGKHAGGTERVVEPDDDAEITAPAHVDRQDASSSGPEPCNDIGHGEPGGGHVGERINDEELVAASADAGCEEEDLYCSIEDRQIREVEVSCPRKALEPDVHNVIASDSLPDPPVEECEAVLEGEENAVSVPGIELARENYYGRDDISTIISGESEADVYYADCGSETDRNDGTGNSISVSSSKQEIGADESTSPVTDYKALEEKNDCSGSKSSDTRQECVVESRVVHQVSSEVDGSHALGDYADCNVGKSFGTGNSTSVSSSKQEIGVEESTCLVTDDMALEKNYCSGSKNSDMRQESTVAHQVSSEVDGSHVPGDDWGSREEGFSSHERDMDKESGCQLPLEIHEIDCLTRETERIAADITNAGLGIMCQQEIQLTAVAEEAERQGSIHCNENDGLAFHEPISTCEDEDDDVSIGTKSGEVSQPFVVEPFHFDDLALAVEKEEDSPQASILKTDTIEPEGVLQVSFSDQFDSAARHIFLASVSNDLHLRLADETEIYQNPSNEICLLQNSLKGSLKSKERITQELVHCRDELRAMTVNKEDLESCFLSMKEEISKLGSMVRELQRKLDFSQEELTCISAELSKCRASLETVQNEKLDLVNKVSSEVNIMKKIEEEKNLLYDQNEVLASELYENNKSLVAALSEQARLEAKLHELGYSVQQLAEEDLYLSTHNVTLQESKDNQPKLPLECEGARTRDGSLTKDVIPSDNLVSLSVASPLPSSLVGKVATVDAGKFDLLRNLRQCFEESEKLLQKLETAVQGMHSYSVSLNRAEVKNAGVSKLIQAFESKALPKDNVSDDVFLTEGGGPDNPYTLSKEHLNELRIMFKLATLDVNKIEAFLIEAHNCIMYCSEYEVQFARQRQWYDTHLAKMDGLLQSISDYECKLEVQSMNFDKIQQNFDIEIERQLLQIELLQRDMNEVTCVYSQEKVSIETIICGTVEKLCFSTGLLVPRDQSLSSRVSTLVNAVVEAIEILEQKLQAANVNNCEVHASYENINKLSKDLQERYELVCGLLNRVYTTLSEIVSHYCQDTGCSLMEVDVAQTGQQFLLSSYEILFDLLKGSLNDRLHLFSKNNELQSELLYINQETEEVKKSFDKALEEISLSKAALESELMKKNSEIDDLHRISLNLVHKIEDHDMDRASKGIGSGGNEHTSESCNIESSLYNNSFSHLAAMIASCLQKYDEAINQVQSSKAYLQSLNNLPDFSADYWSLPFTSLLRDEIARRVNESNELQERVHILNSSISQKENDINILKERSNKVEDALGVAHSEYQSMAIEYEQSEERLSSLREKLSIAVAKGKGLVVQRDGLKQSLAEKSSKLEQLQHQLLSKEALLYEAEEKIKSCSEVGRIEALESELSYIRNSASAMRDSFLLKDSILQRIEEVLEDLDLPENFHSSDIVEKVELLCRVAADNPLSLTLSYQESSVGVVPSDTGTVVRDAWRDDIQLSSNSEFDDLKNKCETLNHKLYGLAEHNNMLEQSLMERNNLVQKWEEILGRIDFPLQLRILEPEDKLEWLGNTLPDVQRQRDSLQRKIENLESSSEMLAVDLEESHKKMSELNAEIVAIKSEKDFFAQNLEQLRYEYHNISERTAQDEIDRENLQKELTDLHQKVAMMNDQHILESDIQKVCALVINTLPECDRSNYLSAGGGLECLEGLVRRLIDRYSSSLGQPWHDTPEKEIVLEERSLLLDAGSLKDIQGEKEEDIVVLKSELTKALQREVILEEEKDSTIEKCQSLVQELNTLTAQLNVLQERTAKLEKYESLEFEFEALRKEKDALQEQLAHDATKSVSVREKLNIAVKKGKALVQQRDELKQTIEEMNGILDNLKAEQNQRVENLESEKALLMDQVANTGKSLQNTNQMLNKILSALHVINVDGEDGIVDPILKIDSIRKYICNLQSALSLSEHDAKKSNHASELLLIELNEVQERADALQEELENSEVSLSNCSRQRDIAEAERAENLSHFEQAMTAYSEEKRRLNESLKDLESDIEQMRKGYSIFSGLLDMVFTRNVDIFCYVESFLDSLLKSVDSEKGSDSLIDLPDILRSNRPINEENFLALSQVRRQKIFNDSWIAKNLDSAVSTLHECLKEYDDLRGNIHKHSYLMDQKSARLLSALGNLKGKIMSYKELFDSLKIDARGLELTIRSLESTIKDKDDEISFSRRCVFMLYEVCSDVITDIKNRRFNVECNMPGDSPLVIVHGINIHNSIDRVNPSSRTDISFTEENIRMIADTLISAVSRLGLTDEKAASAEKKLKDTISDLQRELQEREIQIKMISTNFVSQIKEAESVAAGHLDSARLHICRLEKQVEVLERDKKSLELRIDELRGNENSSKQLNEKIKSLTEILVAKDQESVAFAQALTEEKLQIEFLENKVNDLEKVVEEKSSTMECLEASRTKALAKFSATVNKFDELHDLSENLLAEIENLQSQLQGQDSEISFLRQEVTKCNNDVLVAQESNKKYSSEVNDLLAGMDILVSRFGEGLVQEENKNCSRINSYMGVLDRNLVSVLAELDDLRMSVQSKDTLLQSEKARIEKILLNLELIEDPVRQKETQIQLFQGDKDSSPLPYMNSSQLDTERAKKKMASPTIVPHVRGGRKVNTDQISIAIDGEKKDSVLVDEDDDKAHGFKALTMSRVIPRSTRTIADRIDGIWVSGDRLLMRQPILRLGVLIYWVILHALLVSLI